MRYGAEVGMLEIYHNMVDLCYCAGSREPRSFRELPSWLRLSFGDVMHTVNAHASSDTSGWCNRVYVDGEVP